MRLRVLCLGGFSGLLLLCGVLLRAREQGPGHPRLARPSSFVPEPAVPEVAESATPVPKRPPWKIERSQEPQEVLFERRNLLQLEHLRRRLGPEKQSLVDRLLEAARAHPELFEIGEKDADSIRDFDEYVATFGPYEAEMRELLEALLEGE